MAAGDFTFFNAFREAIADGTHDLDTHTFKVAVLDNTTTPTAADASPTLTSYNQVGTAGTYAAGGTALAGVSWAYSGGTATFDSTTNPSWAADASNDTDAYWGLLYNDTATGDPAVGFVELGGPVNMATTTLTITWGANIFTIT